MGTLCSGRGIWKVKADFPQYYPPRIRWKYGDAVNWNEIQGDDYSIEEEIFTDYNITYIVNYTITMSFEPLNGTPGFIYQAYKQAVGQGKVSNRTDPPIGFVYGGNYWNCPHVYLRREIALGRFDYYPQEFCLGNNANTTNFSYGNNRILSVVINSIKRLGDQPLDKKYTLKIYVNNEKVHEEVNSIRPTVQVLGESCTYLDDWTLVHEETNLNQFAYLISQSLPGNKIGIKKCLASITLDNKPASVCETIKELEGDCNSPKLRGTVEPLCPIGTCELECNGSVCCFDSNGYSVKSY